MTRGAVLLCSFIVLGATSGCRARKAEAVCPPRAGGAVVVALSSMPNTLDWSQSHESSAQNYPVLLAMMRGLTDLDETGAPGPGLARSWEVALSEDSPPRQTWTFHLDQDVVWSDGKTPLLAQDFVFAWRRGVQGADSSEFSDLLGAAEVRAALASPPEGRAERVAQAVEALGVEAVDAHTFRVTLTSPRSYFLSRLAVVYPFFPAPSRVLEGRAEAEVQRYFNEPEDGAPLVLGAFQVKRWDRVAQQVELVANPFDPTRPKTGGVSRLVLVQAELAALMYAQCGVDFLLMDDPSALWHAPKDLVASPLLSTYWLGFNTTAVPLPLRRAIAHALDKEALFTPLKGMIPGLRVAHAFLPPSMPYALQPGDPRLSELPSFDLARAKEELAEAGAEGRELTLLVRSTGTFMPETTIAEGLRRQLGALGITVRIVTTSNFSNDVKDADGTLRHDLFLKRTGADYAHPHTLLTPFLRDGNHYTDWQKLEGGAVVSRFEALLAKGAAQLDPAELTQTYAEAEAVLERDAVAVVPLFYPNRFYRRREWLLGLGVDPFNFLTLRSMRVATGGGGR